MKISSLITGICCLLVLSFTATECAVNCADIATPGTRLNRCSTALTSGTTTACQENCVSILEEYAQTCLTRENSTNVIQRLDHMCAVTSAPIPRQVCTEFATPGSTIYMCNAALPSDPITVCSGNCRSLLEKYADACLDGQTAQAYLYGVRFVCVNTDAVTSEPVTSEPITAEPVTTEPVTTEPITSEPVTTEPVTTEPVTTQPVSNEPVTTNPVTIEVVTTEAVITGNGSNNGNGDDNVDSDGGEDSATTVGATLLYIMSALIIAALTALN